MRKLGEIFLVSDDSGRTVAYLRPADGSPDRYLCSAAADACAVRPHIQQRLIDLAADVAMAVENVVPKAPVGRG
jgi:hypothetical protein